MYKVALNFSDGRTHFIDVNVGETVLDAALRQGITIPVDCREGVCATCKGTCQSGDYQLEYVDEDALSEADLEKGAC
ncbi:2Fe-2S iron-sulfur cluster-binding protein [Marinobacterium aestuariivivens]|uniref:2Fe-2S iron-sulfur cluster-binding protein n=1 Tax=Marinobacterium aestuariivivens TaxID=1698799 RepID=A0ABW1ZWS6_9GAMM